MGLMQWALREVAKALPILALGAWTALSRYVEQRLIAQQKRKQIKHKRK